MKIKKLNLQQVGTKRNFVLEFDEEKPLGEGAQGKVFNVIKINNDITALWAIKLLNVSPGPDLISRLQAVIEFMETNKLNSGGLGCVPIALLQAKANNQIAIAMRRATGPNIEEGAGVPNGGNLQKRLAAAYQLALSVSRLHDKGMVIGDLAYDNIIIDPKNWGLYMIDLDGAEFSWNGKKYPLLFNNSGKGALCPPEHLHQNPYTPDMDLWGLAVLLHFILTDTDPITTFGMALTYADVKKLNWPPIKHPKSIHHLENLQLLGKPLQDAFINIFNEGRMQADKRPTASQWETWLGEAQRYIYQCDCQYDKPFVALESTGKIMTECPYCKDGIAEN